MFIKPCTKDEKEALDEKTEQMEKAHLHELPDTDLSTFGLRVADGGAGRKGSEA